MTNYATMIAALAIAAVVVFAIWDDTPSSRLVSGGCDTGGRHFEDIVTLTTGAGLTTDRYESLQSPQGTFFVIDADHELAICDIVSAIDDSPSAGTRSLSLGHSANTVSDSASAPATSTTIAMFTLPDVDQVVEFESTVFTGFPEGVTPWVRFDPGADWAMTLTGVLVDAE